MTQPTRASPRSSRKPLTRWRLLVYALPLWCFLMTFGMFRIVGHEIDAGWWAAMGLPLFVAGVCFWLQDRRLGMYCIATFLLVLAVTIAEPYFNRAT